MKDNIDLELKRIAAAYKERDTQIYSSEWKSHIYHPRHPMGRLFYEHHYNILVNALNALDLTLDNLSVLDVGCGAGAWLRMLSELGASPKNMTGIDLSANRIEAAKEKNPAMNWIHTNGENIPLPSSTFDIVMQAVVFSSILDNTLARTLAQEMLRVTKPGGSIFWIDHKRSHGESLSGYPIDTLLEYFPGCAISYKESVHPRYFRMFYNHPWLCRTLYDFTKRGCDSWFLVFRKEKQS